MNLKIGKLATFAVIVAFAVSLGAAAEPYPLHKAASLGQMDDARSMLESGMAVNTVDNRGMTPLHNAVVPDHRHEDRSLRMTALLLRFGADPNFTPSSGVSAMDTAVLSASPGVVDLLLVRGGDAKKVFPSGLTLLTIARTAGRENIAEMLEEYGATHGVSQFDRDMVDNLPKAMQFKHGLQVLRVRHGSTRSEEYRSAAARMASIIWPELSLQQAQAMVKNSLALVDPAGDPDAAERDSRR